MRQQEGEVGNRLYPAGETLLSPRTPGHPPLPKVPALHGVR